MDFPHIGDNSFPNVESVNVWKWQNNFDYSRWNAGTCIKLCDVPWCGDYENVVAFESETARDKWLDDAAGHALDLTTDMRVLPDGTIKLPIPFDIAAGFNYCVVDFKPAPGQQPYIAYETDAGKRRFCFFISDMRYMAPNTTELQLSLDYWQTYVYDLEFATVQLERGHAPMAAMPASDYLQNPAANSAGLLTPDVSIDEARTARAAVQALINDGTQYVCFATSANLGGNWGTKAANTWEVAEFNSAVVDGQPVNIRLYAVPANQYAGLCDWIESNIPHFVQTVQGIFLLPAKLLSLSGMFTLGGIAVYVAAPQTNTLADVMITKSLFDYPEEYAEIAKLYTSPYAHLELVDYATGEAHEIRIEDTGGAVGIRALPNLLWPFLSVDILLSGIGGGSGSVSFQRIGAAGMFTYGGAWWRHMTTARIPIYAMTQGNSYYYDATTHYQRRQQSAELSTMLTNTNASADMMVTNSNLALNASVDNLDIGQTAETAIRGRNADKLTADLNADIAYQLAYYNATVAAETAQTNINKSQTVATALTTAAVAIGTVGIAAATGGTGLVAEAAIIGGAATTVTTITGAAISVCSVDASLTLSLTKDAAVLNANVDQMRLKTGYANTLARETQTLQQNATRSQLRTSNAATRNQMANNRDLTKANANRSYSTGQDGIRRQIATAEMMTPNRFGSTTDSRGAGNRPQGAALMAVTQSPGAIKYAGDTFLRYGYVYGAPWQVTELCPMPEFTYWKASDVWTRGARPALEGAQQRIKEIFAAGFTCWKDPDRIGVATIYDNELEVN